MKKIFLLTALAVLLAVATATAQQIAVVSAGGETTICQTLQTAIEIASPGSVIYLPGGGFNLSDDVKITKRLTIIGIGHKSNNDNVDGNTKILGNLWFNEGSSSSAVMGCYITGNVNIGHDGQSVNYVMIKCCDLNSINVNNNTCIETIIDQNYIRGTSFFNQSNSRITNNVIHSIFGVNNGLIAYNILRDYYYRSWGGPPGGFTGVYSCINADNTLINCNIILPVDNKSSSVYGGTYYWRIFEGSNNIITNNLLKLDLGETPINIGDVDWNDVFVNYNGGAINPASNFHFKETYKEYENQVGVYANGVDFDKQTAPVPYIVAKKIDEQTDASGHLGIKVRVKAGE